MAQETPPGIVGKSDWIFYNREFVRNIPESDISVKLISQISKILEDNGTTVLIALAPIKSRIYEEYLPDTRKMTADHKDDYNRLLTQFKVLGVNTVDINSAFLNSPKRTSEFPLYFRHDTHWAAPGALLAAETTKAAIQSNPTLKRAYDQTPETKFNLLWATQRVSMTGDLLRQMPPGSPKYDQEMISAFEVLKQGGGVHCWVMVDPVEWLCWDQATQRLGLNFQVPSTMPCSVMSQACLSLPTWANGTA